MAKHLDALDLTNSRISGCQRFIDAVEKHVADHSAAIDVSRPAFKNNKRAGAIISDMTKLYKIKLQFSFTWH